LRTRAAASHPASWMFTSRPWWATHRLPSRISCGCTLRNRIGAGGWRS
jgi:hypothetical protein